MSTKTPAELQLEVLKKLKAQQLSGKARPQVLKSQDTAGLKRAAPGLSLEGPSQGRKARGQGGSLKLGPAAWNRLKTEGFKSGRLKPGKFLGDWAVELVLNIPPELAGLTEEAKREIYAKISDWSKARGLS